MTYIYCNNSKLPH